MNIDILCEKADTKKQAKTLSAVVLVDDNSDIKQVFELIEELNADGYTAQIIAIENIALAVVQSGFDRTFVVEGQTEREVL